MHKLLLILGFSLFLFSICLRLQKGEIIAHTEVLNPKTQSISSELTFYKTFESIKGIIRISTINTIFNETLN